MTLPPDPPSEDRDPVTLRQIALLISTFTFGLLVVGLVILVVVFLFFPPALAFWGTHV